RMPSRRMEVDWPYPRLSHWGLWERRKSRQAPTWKSSLWERRKSRQPPAWKSPLWERRKSRQTPAATETFPAGPTPATPRHCPHAPDPPPGRRLQSPPPRPELPPRPVLLRHHRVPSTPPPFREVGHGVRLLSQVPLRRALEGLDAA